MAAKKTNSAPKSKIGATVSKTAVRNTSLPPRQSATQASAPKKSPPTYDQIARRAYEIWTSGKGGSQDDNWFRAERELRRV